MTSSSKQRIIFIDGDCVLCHSVAHFVIAHERAEYPPPRCFFSTLEMGHASGLLPELGIDVTCDSVVFYDVGSVQIESEAVLRIARYLRWPWSMLPLFSFLPRCFRDRLYRWVADSRYRWFGKKSDSCSFHPGLAERLLEVDDLVCIKNNIYKDD